MPIIEDIKSYLLDKMKVPAQDYANKIMAKVIKKIFLAVVGVSFVTTGLIFLLIGVVAYLTQVIAPWMAWGIVGLITAFVGALLLLILRR